MGGRHRRDRRHDDILRVAHAVDVAPVADEDGRRGDLLGHEARLPRARSDAISGNVFPTSVC